MIRAVIVNERRRIPLKTQMETGCAGRTPIGGSKSEGKREACRVLEANVVQPQLSQVVGELSAQYQALVCSRKPQLLAREAKHALRAACLALSQTSCSCSSRDYDSRACKASKRSTSCSADPGSWQTHSPQVAGAIEHLPLTQRLASYPFDSFHSMTMVRASQEIGCNVFRLRSFTSGRVYD